MYRRTEILVGPVIRGAKVRVLDVWCDLQLDRLLPAALVNAILWNLLNIDIAVGLVRRPGRTVGQAG